MSNLSKAAQVMLDADAGQPIEQRDNVKGSAWQDSPTPSWDWSKYIYRVKKGRQYHCIEDDRRAYRIHCSADEAAKVLANEFKDYPGIRITELIPKPVS